MIDGLLVVDKPAGPTSHDVVAAVRRAAGQKKVGHAGTLDPAATGVLVLLLGRLTRLADVFSGQAKSYRAVIELGMSTTTGDAEGEPVERAEVPSLDDAELEDAVQALVGTRTQTPPAYSAAKVDGKPLYERARAGEPIPKARPKTVTVISAQLTEARLPRLTVEFEVSKGTYVRVLAEELGSSLGVPSHLAALVRTASGPFTLDESHELQELTEGGVDAVADACLDLRAHSLGVRRGYVGPDVVARARHGHWVSSKHVRWLDPESDQVLLLDDVGVVGWYRVEGPVLKPKAVLRTDGGAGR